jgi:C-8 sterol isomerase
MLAVVIGAISSLMYFLESHLEKFYIFTPSELQSLTQDALKTHGNDTSSVVEYIVSHLSATHPKHVNLDEEWIFNNAGGAMGAMYIIHASVTEYLIIFGSAIGTEGSTGRHTADDYFYILKGAELAYAPGKGVFEPEIYPQGTVHHLKRGQVKQYKMDSACFALEYARGWIPPMLGFGYADSKSSPAFFREGMNDWTAGRFGKNFDREKLPEDSVANDKPAFSSTLDFPTLWRTTWVTGREMVGNLLIGKL